MYKRFTVYHSSDYRYSDPLGTVTLEGDKNLVDMLEKAVRHKILEQYEVR